ncbi:MAG: hypothetical protein GF347_02180 [Candidatus Moranbacteria bacterium]|nr:hypothetical protein [Candidatus Moranbacteria bacterium]
MEIIDKKISINQLKKMAKQMFGTFVKGVVDIDKEIMAIDAELHADQEMELLKQGSKQNNLWGINLYPEFFGGKKFIEFDSMINIRPSQNNRSRSVDDKIIQKKIIKVVNKLVKK